MISEDHIKSLKPPFEIMNNMIAFVAEISELVGKLTLASNGR